MENDSRISGVTLASCWQRHGCLIFALADSPLHSNATGALACLRRSQSKALHSVSPPSIQSPREPSPCSAPCFPGNSLPTGSAIAISSASFFPRHTSQLLHEAGRRTDRVCPLTSDDCAGTASLRIQGLVPLSRNSKRCHRHAGRSRVSQHRLLSRLLYVKTIRAIKTNATKELPVGKRGISHS